MRTDEEIIERIRKIECKDIFSIETNDLAQYLPPTKLEKIGVEVYEDYIPRSSAHDSIKQEILNYLPFAWDKANNCRGLSAARNLFHMRAWLWMLGEEDAAEAMESYTNYGKPQLREISEKYGFNWRLHDNGCWTNSEEHNGVPSNEVAAIDMKWKV